MQLYEEPGNAGVVCLRCGISRPTLRKWWTRYQEHGEAGLKDESRQPKSSPFKKVLPAYEQLIADLRKRKLGHRRIQNELPRLHDISLSTATIHKVLERIGRPILHHKRAYRKQVIRHNPALWNAFACCSKQTVINASCLDEFPEQCQQALIGDTLTNSLHE